MKQMCFDSIQPSFHWKAPFKTYPGKASVNYSLCLLIYLVLFDNHQIEKILRASRNVSLVKEAKLAKTFVCLHSWLACFSVPKCETTLHVSASQRSTFVMPPKFFNTRNGKGCVLKYAVAIWPVTGQGFQNTKWPAVLYYQ